MFSSKKNWLGTITVVCCAMLSFTGEYTFAEQRPERVASTHLCTDQLLMLLAEPERIVSLSYFASNPDMSMMAESARPYPVNHGLAEELVLQKPDLILTSQFGSPSILILKSLGYQVLSVPVALTLEDIRENIQTVADAIGDPNRGREVVRQFDLELNQVSAPFHEPRPKMLIYEANGYTTGKHTLQSDILKTAGFTNLADELGISGNQYLPLEVLVIHPLDALMTASDYGQNSLAYEVPNHPALRSAFENVPRVNIPGKIWICGTPFVLDALRLLTEFRIEVAESVK